MGMMFGGVGHVRKTGKDNTFANNLLELCQQGSPAAYPHDQIENLVDNFVAYELKAMRRRRRWASLLFWKRLIPWAVRRYRRLLATERRLEAENTAKEQAEKLRSEAQEIAAKDPLGIYQPLWDAAASAVDLGRRRALSGDVRPSVTAPSPAPRE